MKYAQRCKACKNHRLNTSEERWWCAAITLLTGPRLAIDIGIACEHFESDELVCDHEFSHTMRLPFTGTEFKRCSKCYYRKLITVPNNISAYLHRPWTTRVRKYFESKRGAG